MGFFLLFADDNGIIMGEFGFVTADGIYHVTVYATDENGDFKILKMKNIKVGFRKYSFLLHVTVTGSAGYNLTNSVAIICERTVPTEQAPLVGDVMPTFADTGCCVVSPTDPCGRILGFIDRSRYVSFLVAPQLYS
jgi:hypothetical protein